MRMLQLVLAVLLLISCSQQEQQPQSEQVQFDVSVEPIATVTAVGVDTLSDSARVVSLEPEPDGTSIAFQFSDPAKGVSSGLGILHTDGSRAPQLIWPDSVLSVWWSKPHELSFTAGTGQGVRVVVDVHAVTLEAVSSTISANTPQPANSTESQAAALSRAQRFIDSIRVQPEGTPQGSSLRYRADTVLHSPTDSVAAVHVTAGGSAADPVNPAWYVIHLPSGTVHPIDSLTGESSGLAARGGRWGADGNFYYTRERSIFRARPQVRKE
jgi:hypothetical protein